MNRASGTCGALTKGLTCTLSESKWQRATLEKYSKKRWLKTCKFGKIHKTTDSRSYVNPRQDKAKKYTPRYITVTLLKTKDKVKTS